MYKTFLNNDFFDSVVHGILNDYKNENYYGQSKIETNDDEYVIHLSVPGLTKDDLRIVVENSYITISYKIEKDKNPKSLFVEDFEKTYRLPKDVNVENIDATIKDGICKIKIPKDKQKIIKKLISIS